ncbi:MAG TPA: sulfite oxidase [Gaiellaceae bacterium]|nr:sulfite oxidase [Gaiellaceae bacterium]
MEGISLEELQLAARNHGMPLEALRYPVTPVGLHYLLIHYDVPAVESEGWRLTIGGERELELSLDELRARPAAEQTVTMECAGNGRARLEPRPVSQPWLLEAVGTARWRGTALRPLLEEAGIPEGTVEVLLTGLDRGIEGGDEQSFQRALPLDEARREEVLLAYEMNGAPLPPQHGFPLRLVVPGWYGMTNVKWLSRIEFLDEPFAGYQQSWSYRVRQSEDEEGVPLGRMQPRSLLVPPGIPEFLSRDRTVEAGEVTVEGRAWSGLAPIASVEVSDDGGSSWAPAELEPAGEPWAWRGWSYRWDAEPGEHLLCSRARDEAGNEQPVEPPWNLGGYANNSLQTVRVTVTG